MRKVKTYALREPLPVSDAKLTKRAQAVIDALRGGPKTAKEVQASLAKYAAGSIGAALSDLRKAGLLSE